MLKVFIGSAPEQYVPSKVLEASIKRYASCDVEVHLMYELQEETGLTHAIPKHGHNRPRTPFSFQRFMIPSWTKGKAIYMDSDMQVFEDMAPLLDLDFGDADVLSCKDMHKYSHWRGSEYAFLLMDCDKINWDVNSIVEDLDNGKYRYEDLMFQFCVANTKECIDPNWNSLDVYEKGVTKNLHYTNMSTQPWRAGIGVHKHEDVWTEGLEYALDSGILDKKIYDEHLRIGIVKAMREGNVRTS